MRKKRQPGNPRGYTLTPPKLPGLEELSVIAARARRDGFIAIQDITMILSSDESYTDRLPVLWEEYQMGIRRNFPDDISTPESRFGVWYALFERWTSKTVAAVPGGLRPIKGLPGYIYDTEKDDHVKVKGSEVDPDYIIPDNLKSYFTEYLEIHLPAMLFPPDKAQLKKSTARTSKNQLKEKVRAVAEKLWKENASITKADMALHDDINSIPGASEKTEKTLGGWIKDLNPNRRPGRRPKQT
jgi:hypothetical protein